MGDVFDLRGRLPARSSSKPPLRVCFSPINVEGRDGYEGVYSLDIHVGLPTGHPISIVICTDEMQGLNGSITVDDNKGDAVDFQIMLKRPALSTWTEYFEDGGLLLCTFETSEDFVGNLHENQICQWRRQGQWLILNDTDRERVRDR